MDCEGSIGRKGLAQDILSHKVGGLCQKEGKPVQRLREVLSSWIWLAPILFPYSYNRFTTTNVKGDYLFYEFLKFFPQ